MGGQGGENINISELQWRKIILINHSALVHMIHAYPSCYALLDGIHHTDRAVITYVM